MTPHRGPEASPAKAIEGLRLEAARLMIEHSRQPMEIVARVSGFRDQRHLHEVFIKKCGGAPVPRASHCGPTNEGCAPRAAGLQ